MNYLETVISILDNRAELDYYRETAEVNDILNGELLPEVTFENYGDDN